MDKFMNIAANVISAIIMILIAGIIIGLSVYGLITVWSLFL